MLYSPDWLWTHDSPALSLQGWGWQACATTPASSALFFKIQTSFFRINFFPWHSRPSPTLLPSLFGLFSSTSLCLSHSKVFFIPQTHPVVSRVSYPALFIHQEPTRSPLLHVTFPCALSCFLLCDPQHWPLHYSHRGRACHTPQGTSSRSSPVQSSI